MSYSSLRHWDFQSNLFHSCPIARTFPTDEHQRGPRAESQFYPLGASLVARPIHFAEGQFAGRIVRTALEEMQEPEFGRKTVSAPREAKVDRRPLDPAPVASLSLFETSSDGMTETEIANENVDVSGLMCSVDLFTVQPPEASPPVDGSTSSDSSLSAYEMSSMPRAPSFQTSSKRSPCKASSELAGTTVIEAISIAWKGRTCILFPFADLAVKKEGFFMLQYRFFDIFSVPAGQTHPTIQAECWGAPFRIYSTKEAPKLGASTELSKALARHGVRLNLREVARKRKHNRRNADSLFTTRVLLESQDMPENNSDDEYE
ncbi:velvet factor-domain-containing protein [Mycena galopus ATCC 62051]|nr:velvet factor-domain-containing protein [Mycena galopus ATCC 62051]